MRHWGSLRLCDRVKVDKWDMRFLGVSAAGVVDAGRNGWRMACY